MHFSIAALSAILINSASARYFKVGLVGDQCSAHAISSCAAGLTCQRKNVCTGVLPPNSDCFRNSDCADVDGVSHACVQTNAHGKSECKPAFQKGEQCYNHKDCVGRNSCIQVDLDGRRECQPLTLKGECFRSVDCPSSRFLSYSCIQTEATGKRECKPLGKLGSTCYHSSYCSGQLWCNNGDDRTVPGECIA